jgi:hypothetical protein
MLSFCDNLDETLIKSDREIWLEEVAATPEASGRC